MKDRAASHGNLSDFPIAIIGAGFAGIGTAIQLKKAGIQEFTIFERACEIGGTWRDNTYPGAACDVPSHVYSFSFEPSPNWNRAYAESHEIQGYLLSLWRSGGYVNTCGSDARSSRPVSTKRSEPGRSRPRSANA